MNDSGGGSTGVQPYGASQPSTQLGAVQGLGSAALDPNSNYGGALAQLTGTSNTGAPSANPNATSSSSSNTTSIQSLMSQIMSMLGGS